MIDLAWHSFERVFGSSGNPKQRFQTDQTQQALIQEGFSAQEAKELSWLYNHRSNGRTYGIIVNIQGFVIGLATAYCVDPWVKKWTNLLPYMRLHKSPVWISRALVVFAALQTWDYMYTARRSGGNSGLMNDLQWVNTRYTKSKEAFIRNFEVLNRGFTDIEKQILHSNQQVKVGGHSNRRWIYNPNLHGDNEQAFWEDIKRNYIDQVAPWERYDVQQEIVVKNHEKINAGEKIQVKPYKLLNDLDSTGLKHGLKQNPVTNRWTPLL